MASVLTHQNYCLLEIEALHSATSSIQLQDEIEMLASSIEQTTRSMSKLAGKCMTLLLATNIFLLENFSLGFFF